MAAVASGRRGDASQSAAPTSAAGTAAPPRRAHQIGCSPGRRRATRPAGVPRSGTRRRSSAGPPSAATRSARPRVDGDRRVEGVALRVGQRVARGEIEGGGAVSRNRVRDRGGRGPVRRRAPVARFVGAGAGGREQDPAQGDAADDGHDHSKAPTLRRPTPLVDHGGRLATASCLAEGLRTLAGMLDVEAAAQNAEIDRLRDLIGPSQESYDQLKATLDAAETAARSAQQAAGESARRVLLRGPGRTGASSADAGRARPPRLSGSPFGPPAGRVGRSAAARRADHGPPPVSEALDAVRAGARRRGGRASRAVRLGGRGRRARRRRRRRRVCRRAVRGRCRSWRSPPSPLATLAITISVALRNDEIMSVAALSLAVTPAALTGVAAGRPWAAVAVVAACGAGRARLVRGRCVGQRHHRFERRGRRRRRVGRSTRPTGSRHPRGATRSTERGRCCGRASVGSTWRSSCRPPAGSCGGSPPAPWPARR